MQYGDEVIVDSIQDFGGTHGSLTQTFAWVMFAGADILVKSENRVFSKAERSALIPFVIAGNILPLNFLSPQKGDQLSVISQLLHRFKHSPHLIDYSAPK